MIEVVRNPSESLGITLESPRNPSKPIVESPNFGVGLHVLLAIFFLYKLMVRRSEACKNA